MNRSNRFNDGVYDKKSPKEIGNKLHKQYSYALRDFDRVRVLYILDKYLTRGALQLKIEYKDFIVYLRGLFDDLNVLRYNGKKYLSFIELKTTNKKILWNKEILSAIKQLQLYVYIIKELAGKELEKLGYYFWIRHYVEIYSQKTGLLIKRIAIKEDENIKEWVKYTIEVFSGKKPMYFSHFSYCHICPLTVKSLCSYYQLRREDKKVATYSKIF